MKRKSKLTRMIGLCVSLAGLFAMLAAPSAVAQEAEEEATYTTEYIFYVGDAPDGIIDMQAADSTDAVARANLISMAMIDFYPTGSGTFIHMFVSTEAASEMNKIGIKDMYVDKFKDGQWTDYLEAHDLYNTNSDYHEEEREFAVTYGYMYRARVIHYAEKKGFIFTDRQSLENESGQVDFRE